VLIILVKINVYIKMHGATININNKDSFLRIYFNSLHVSSNLVLIILVKINVYIKMHGATININDKDSFLCIYFNSLHVARNV
jgi:hypothetical protein